MSRLSQIEFVVLDNLLSDFNDDLTFPKLLEAIADEDWDQACPWEVIEDIPGQDLANIISDLVRDLKRIGKN
jgi:hypothetical protein